MRRLPLIVFLATAVVCPGCQSIENHHIHAVWDKCLQVKEGMSQSQVYAFVLPPNLTLGADDGNQTACWTYGRPFANRDYISMVIVFGKDDRVVSVDRDLLQGHEIHDLPTWP